MRRLPLLSAVVALALVASACPRPIDPSAKADAKRKAADEVRRKRSETRPPFPNMATPAWGKIVIEKAADKADTTLSGKGAKAAVEASKAALHQRDGGAEKRLAAASAALWRAAMEDGDRALAASLHAAALVLDPNVDGYRQRLVDAAGLVSYASSLRGGTVVAQSAQAMVLIAIGRNHAGKQLLAALTSNEKLNERLDAEASLLLAHARYLVGNRSDAFFLDVNRAIKGAPTSVRARALKSHALLDLGFTRRAAEIAARAPVKTPYLEALAVMGAATSENTSATVDQLRAIESRVREPDRGEVLYWLALVLTKDPAGHAEAMKIAGNLTTRAGFAAESAVIRAFLALQKGDGKTAFKTADRVAKTAGAAPAVSLEALWLVVDSCALNGDVDCVQRRGTNAVGADGNRARWAHAMAALVFVGKVDPKSVVPPLDADAMLRLAHRMSPFDPELAKRVGDEVSSGGETLASRVRATRRAMVMDARGLALEALSKEVPADCRVCRALQAISNRDAIAGARGALLAVRGKGPPLSEDDLVAVIDVLGSVPVDGSKDVLFALGKDPRENVRKAVARAQKDLANPAERKKREEKKGDDHDHEPGAIPTPRPGMTPPRMPKSPGPKPKLPTPTPPTAPASAK